MDKSVFRFIWRYSKWDQLRIVAIVLLSLPFYFLSLDLPKTIVNEAIQGEGFADGATRTSFSFVTPSGWWGESVTLFGGIELDRVSFLIWMSFAFLALVIVNGLFKLVINTTKGRMGERMLRRLRFMLFDRILRFPFAHFRKVKAPELATMIKDEIEPLGGFIGDAYVQPVFLGGQTLTAMAFIITQNLWLGLLAGAIAIAQALLIPKLRAPLLKLGRERQLTARDLAGRIGEAVDGIEQILVNDTARFERANMAARLGRIFSIRFQLYQKKFSVKFVNNMLSQLTPFLFFLIGGLLAINGKLDVGQLVAVIVAYKDLPGPMKELIDWDQRRQDTQIKYEQVVSQFAPSGLAEPVQAETHEGELQGPLTLSNLTVAEDGEPPMLNRVSATFDLTESVAMVGVGSSRLIEAVARLRVPKSGLVQFGDTSLFSLSNAAVGRNIAYLGPRIYLHGPSLFDTMAYTLKRQPGEGTNRDTIEARRTGNAEDDPESDWIDYATAGVLDRRELREVMLHTLSVVEMEDDLFRWGLRQPVNTEVLETHDILRARSIIAARIEDQGLNEMVERFDPERYCENATIGENLRFGAAKHPDFSDDVLYKNRQLRTVLRDLGLSDRFVEIGRGIGATLLEIFADISPDNPLIEQFSFVDASELPKVKAALERNAETQDDRGRFFNLALSYVEVLHRLDVLDDALKNQIVEARHAFQKKIGKTSREKIAFYDSKTPTEGAPLIDDLLFGRVSFGVSQSNEQVEALVYSALDAERILPVVLEAGLEHDIGPAGKQLSPSQQQRIGLARALLRRPQILLLNEPFVTVEEMLARRILTRTVALRKGMATYAALARPQYADIFNRRISFEAGQVKSDELAEPKSADAIGGLNDEVAILAQVPLFSNFEPATLKLLAFASRRITFTEGQTLFQQGDKAEIAYVVLSGTADILGDSADGAVKIASVGKNEFVGEVALLSDAPRSATVRATEELVVLEITKDIFFRLLKDFPSLSFEVMHELAERLQRTTAKIIAQQGDP